MSLNVFTDNPNALLQKIKHGIEDKSIETWTLTSRGRFTHSTSSEQWENKAFFEAEIETGILKFLLRRPPGVALLTNQIRGIYHGRFISMLATHFPSSFTSITAKIP